MAHLKSSLVRDKPVSDQGFEARRQHIKMIARLSDEDLRRLNKMLPWASYITDDRGRAFGAAYSHNKRTKPQLTPDPRIVELDKRVPLANLSVLELGCFEGHHTSALCTRARHVTAIDARIENVVKTLVRCAMFGHQPQVELLDLEEPFPNDISLECDVLHHVGVLYHLTDPVRHLTDICSKTKTMLMLDTHIARPTDDLANYESCGKRYHYLPFRESGRKAPFAGMRDHAKWLLEKDLVTLLHDCGFKNIDITQRREEKNGLRILIYASR